MKDGDVAGLAAFNGHSALLSIKKLDERNILSNIMKLSISVIRLHLMYKLKMRKRNVQKSRVTRYIFALVPIFVLAKTSLLASIVAMAKHGKKSGNRSKCDLITLVFSWVQDLRYSTMPQFPVGDMSILKSSTIPEWRISNLINSLKLYNQVIQYMVIQIVLR